ncbi:MAG: hypothetical protein ACJA02_000366 [Myxococcota bacterium]|jgi:hypothetical protein
MPKSEQDIKEKQNEFQILTKENAIASVIPNPIFRWIF